MALKVTSPKETPVREEYEGRYAGVMSSVSKNGPGSVRVWRV